MEVENHITIGHSSITGDYIYEHGQESLLILALLSRHYTIRREFVFNMRYLYSKLKIPLGSKDRKDRIVECINRTLSTDIKTNANIDELLVVPYKTEKGYYLIVTDEEVDKILGYEKRINKFSLFNTYVVIKRYVNYNSQKSYPSINRIMTITNVASNNTTMKYIKILEDLGMIVCTRGDGYIVKDEKIRRSNNEYKII